MRTILPKWLSSACARSRCVKRSPSVTNRVPSRANTRREPKWLPPETALRCAKMVRVPRSAGVGPSTSSARATAVRAPASAGSLNDRNSEPSRAKPGPGTTSSSPPWPRANTAGTPASGAEARPSRPMMRSRPGRSVTSMRPSGRNASDHGCARPRAISVTRGGDAAAAARAAGRPMTAAADRARRLVRRVRSGPMLSMLRRCREPDRDDPGATRTAGASRRFGRAAGAARPSPGSRGRPAAIDAMVARPASLSRPACASACRWRFICATTAGALRAMCSR